MRRSVIAALGMYFCFGALMQVAFADAFTYQGKLTDGGVPANGNYAIDVELWDAVSLGNQVGSTLSFANVTVADGLFTLQLDFGADAFDNSGRWLRIMMELPLANSTIKGQDETIMSASASVTSVQRVTEGIYWICIDGGAMESDVMSVSFRHKGYANVAELNSGTMIAQTFDSANTLDNQDRDVSFIVCRP